MVSAYYRLLTGHSDHFFPLKEHLEVEGSF